MTKKTNSSPVPNQISGFFLSFTEEETKFIQDILSDFDYPEGPAGIKKWLLDSMKTAIDDPPPTTTDRVIEKIGDTILKNPQKIVQGIQVAGTFLNVLIKKGRS